MSQIYLVEVVASTPSTEVSVTIYRYATSGYVTRPTDDPADTYYEPRVRQPGLVRRDLFSGGSAFGRTQVGYGEVTLINTDGALDFLADKGFGRPIRILVGDQAAAYSAFTLVLQATVEQAEVGTSSVTLRVKDSQSLLDTPLQTATFAGNNVAPNGAEGTADDLKGQRKPKLYGKVFNLSPPMVNSSMLTYQVNSGSATVSAVYDKAVALTFGANYANLAALEAATVPGGEYATCSSLGLFRLGSSPVGTVTCDATAGSEYLADILGAIAVDAGTTMSSADITALKAANGALGGVYFQDSSTDSSSGTTGLQLLDEVAQSLGAWYGFDQADGLRCGRVEAPTGAAVASFRPSDIIALEQVAANDDLSGLPVWKVSVLWKKFHTVQKENDVAGSVSAARRVELAQEYRTAVSYDSALLWSYPNAKELTRTTLMTSESDAQAEASRLLSLLKVRRRTYTATVRWESELATTLDIGQTVSITFPRFGLLAGKLLLITGLTLDLRLKRAELSLWG
jgi:hypothetical protein